MNTSRGSKSILENPDAKRPVFLRLLAALLTIGAAGQTFAQSFDNIQIHGFGGWSYADTNGNRYLQGTEDGAYDRAQMSLNLSADPSESLKLNAQSTWNIADENIELDFAFATWTFSDAFKVGLGKIKQPFGISTEVYDVGTIRPFYNLPVSVYGRTGILAKGFDGVMASGGFYSLNKWGFEYNIYGGKIDLRVFHPWELLNEEDGQEPADNARELSDIETEKTEVSDSLGFRFNILTPLEGLTFGFSAYSGSPTIHQEADHEEEEEHEGGEEEEEHEGDEEEEEHEGGEEEEEHETEVASIGWGDHYSYGTHVDYRNDKFWARAEYVKNVQASAAFNAFYTELAYFVGEKTQLTALYEKVDGEISEHERPSEAFASVSKHQDIAFGINYWFGYNKVAKLSYHFVNGNLYALDLASLKQGGSLKQRTNFVELGFQFSF